jgi:hypothetical protein
MSFRTDNGGHDLQKDCLLVDGPEFRCGYVGLALLPRWAFMNQLGVRFTSVRAISQGVSGENCSRFSERWCCPFFEAR